MALPSVKPDASALLPTQPVIVTGVFAVLVVGAVCPNAGTTVNRAIPQSTIRFMVPPIHPDECKGGAVRVTLP
jgi:hypothetical protein